MIHGLKVDVKAEELVVRLGARIQHHESKAKLCGTQLRKRKGTPRGKNDGDVERRFGEQESPVQKLARKKRGHEDRAAALTFVRDHVVPGEVYRLDEGDLRLADLVPEGFTRWPRA